VANPSATRGGDLGVQYTQAIAEQGRGREPLLLSAYGGPVHNEHVLRGAVVVGRLEPEGYVIL
jgi:hypothetical protein